MSVQLELFSDEIFFLPDRNSVTVRLIREGSDNSLFQLSPWSIDFTQIECPTASTAEPLPAPIQCAPQSLFQKQGTIMPGLSSCGFSIVQRQGSQIGN